MESLPEMSTYEEKEVLVEKIIFFVTAKLEEALSRYRVGLASGAKKDIVQCLLEIWPENDGIPWQRRPRFNVPGTDILIRFESQTSEYDSVNKTMSLPVGKLRSAKTSEELDLAFTHLMQSMYHETEHIFNPGQELAGTDDIQEMISYLCNEGEIRAHAKEYAYRYVKEYPGEPFDLLKMQELALKLQAEGKPNARNYFIVFADPEKQEKYGLYGDVKKAHDNMMTMVGKIIN